MFDWYPAHEYDCARAQLVLFTLGMGMTLSFGDFVEIARRPRSFGAGLLGHLFVIPLIAVLINWLANFDAGICVGLILVAAMPGGAMSKLFAYFGRGNMALSISLTGVSTLLTLVTVPLMLQILATRYMGDVAFTMPVVEILTDVALCLFLPLVAGLTVARIWPKHHRLLSKICIRIGLLVVVVMVAGSLGSGRIRPGQYGIGVPVAIILFCVIGMQVNMLLFYLCKWPRPDRFAVGIEVTMRNMNLALLIYARLFHDASDEAMIAMRPGVLFVILFYAATAMGAGLLLTLNHRRMARNDQVEPIATS